MISFSYDNEALSKALVSRGFKGNDINVVGMVIENEANDRFVVIKDDDCGEYVFGDIEVKRV